MTIINLMITVPVAEILNATTFTSLRSIISKLVEKQETGKWITRQRCNLVVWNIFPWPLYLDFWETTTLTLALRLRKSWQQISIFTISITAKVNSLFSLTETLAALLFHPFYSWLYMKTLHVLPGTVFLVSAAFIIPAAIILT